MNVALIPVRGGSKSIPLKNIKEMCGRPLVYWTAKAACDCTYIDEVYVSTDSTEIKGTVEKFVSEPDDSTDFSKVHVIGRSPETATDTASTESVMLEFAKKYSFDNIALVQATSPLLTGRDLDNGFAKLLEADSSRYESILSVVEQKRFNWHEGADGTVEPINYDFYNRPRRQDFNGYLVENGAFYITSKEALLKTKCRLSGRVGAVKMPEESYYEIDEPSDWIIAESILKRRNKPDNAELFKNIKMLVTDCDGCLTDGGMYYSENGDELKRFNVKDGKGLNLLREAGIKTAIITGENRELNRRRAEKLKITVLKMGINDNKLEVLKEICTQEGISIKDVVYIGDDLNDLECIKGAGVGVAVANAEDIIKENADYITKTPGGSGAIREVANLILEMHSNDLKMRNNKSYRYYVMCPPFFQSGGPELCHQLCEQLNKLNRNAKILYNEQGSIEPIDTEPVPRFIKYNTSHVTSLEEVDTEDSIVVINEINTVIIPQLKKARKVLWWMSVDNFINSKKPDNEILQQDIALHLVQSQYAYDYVKNVINAPEDKIIYLSDYTHENFKRKIPRNLGFERDVVLYNPQKGYDKLQPLIEMTPEISWVALRNLMEPDMINLMQFSKVYVDFGRHPGKDRIPREAAIMGCCVITNKEGSAKYYEDVPIPDKYKFDEYDYVKVKELILHICSNFNECSKDFDHYREVISKEHEKFINDTENMIKVLESI